MEHIYIYHLMSWVLLKIYAMSFITEKLDVKLLSKFKFLLMEGWLCFWLSSQDLYKVVRSVLMFNGKILRFLMIYWFYIDADSSACRFIYLDDLMRFLQEDEASKTLNLVEGSAESDKISKASLKNWVVWSIPPLLFLHKFERNICISLICT